MRRWLGVMAALAVVAAVALGAPPAWSDAPSATAAPARDPAPWLVTDIGIIGPSSADQLRGALSQVAEGHDAGLILRLDTPGGSLESARDMVKTMLSADVPIIVWVGPAGARAGSAGAFITLAANIAAMAPGTNIGAAHPVDTMGHNIPGGGRGGDDDDGKGREGSDMRAKITNDTLAFIESIAKTRHRNVDMARSFVATSVSITDEEALAQKVIDVRAKDLDELMSAVDGRQVEVAGGKLVTLRTKGAPRIEAEVTLRQRLLEVLSNPNLFYLLFLAGLIGLGYELTHPGMYFPGIAGAICLILALISMSVLPISYGAVALILVGIILMIAEAHLPTFGAAGIGGVIAFVLGSIFLVDPTGAEGLRISWFAIVPGATVTGGAFITLGFLSLRARRAPVRSGSEGMIGRSATVLADFIDGKGTVRADGAIWSARLAPPDVGRPVVRGDSVTIKAVRGLELEVAKTSESLA